MALIVLLCKFRWEEEITILALLQNVHNRMPYFLVSFLVIPLPYSKGFLVISYPYILKGFIKFELFKKDSGLNPKIVFVNSKYSKFFNIKISMGSYLNWNSVLFKKNALFFFN